MPKETNTENKLTVLNILVFILSIYVLGALVIDTVFKLQYETEELLIYIDHTICAFFFFEFCYNFYHAKNKVKFMHWGWIDLLSSIPLVGFLRAGRVFRLIRLIRVIRAFKTTKHVVSHVFANKIEGTLTSVFVIAILLLIFSSIAILQVEHDPHSNIKTAEDALWWAYVTITTVGYGDRYPVTSEGRILAAVLMTAGVGLFGTFTAYISSLFVANQRKVNSENKTNND
jgi:voltage-gated potassium channel